MIYLIVPPIIIILAIAILIVFLVRVLPSEKRDDGNLSLKDKSIIKDQLKKSKKFLQDTGGNVTKQIKKSLKTKNVSNGNIVVTHDTVMDENIKNVVLLRRKSMVSDKINDGEDRDVEEISLMKNIETDSQNSKKYECLGDYYMEHEKFEDARECYKYVLRLDPRHKRAQVAMRNLDRVLQ